MGWISELCYVKLDLSFLCFSVYTTDTESTKPTHEFEFLRTQLSTERASSAACIGWGLYGNVEETVAPGEAQDRWDMDQQCTVCTGFKADCSRRQLDEERLDCEGGRECRVLPLPFLCYSAVYQVLDDTFDVQYDLMTTAYFYKVDQMILDGWH